MVIGTTGCVWWLVRRAAGAHGDYVRLYAVVLGASGAEEKVWRPTTASASRVYLAELFSQSPSCISRVKLSEVLTRKLAYEPLAYMLTVSEVRLDTG